MTSRDSRLQRSAPCRFCGRSATTTEHRMPGPHGPVCTGCLETGLELVRDGRPRPGLVRLRSADEAACEFCGRRDRQTFLGFRRPLSRMGHSGTGAVICADCLDRGADLINRVLRQ